jgi:hypothetical protein
MPNFTLIEKYFLLINSDKQTYKNLKIDFQKNMNLGNTQRREGKIVFKRQFLSLRRDVKKKKNLCPCTLWPHSFKYNVYTHVLVVAKQ